eukprot:72714-Pyramimonas_sp.AAC.1
MIAKRARLNSQCYSGRTSAPRSSTPPRGLPSARETPCATLAPNTQSPWPRPTVSKRRASAPSAQSTRPWRWAQTRASPPARTPRLHAQSRGASRANPVPDAAAIFPKPLADANMIPKHPRRRAHSQKLWFTCAGHRAGFRRWCPRARPRTHASPLRTPWQPCRPRRRHPAWQINARASSNDRDAERPCSAIPGPQAPTSTAGQASPTHGRDGARRPEYSDRQPAVLSGANAEGATRPVMMERRRCQAGAAGRGDCWEGG